MKSMVWAVFQYGVIGVEGCVEWDVKLYYTILWSGGMDFEEIGQKQNSSF